MTASRMAALLLGAGLALAAASASADPSIWQRANDPLAKHVDRALRRAEYMLESAEESGGDPGLRRNFAMNTVAMMELFGDRQLPDARLKFLTAQALIEAKVGREPEIRALLESALRDAPDSYYAADAWLNLGVTCAKLGDSRCEYDAYTRALDITWESEVRANLYMNRGESQMTMGNLQDAIRDYRRAVRLASAPDLQSLAHFGLGVALERSGDLPSALAAITIADSIRVPIPFGLVLCALDLPSVFFNPDYEIHYYKALAHMAAAEHASEPTDKRREYELAIERWNRYLDGAEPDAQRWVPNARAHRARCERAAEKLPKGEASDPGI